MRPFVIALLLLAGRVAAADPDTLAAPPAAPDPELEDAKSPALATTIALVGTAIPIALFYGGIADHDHDRGETTALLGAATLILTPSAGHWYAGRFWTVGMGVRAGGATLVILGAAQLLGEGDGDAGGVLVIGGVLSIAGGALVDIVTASSEADAWNRAHASHLRPVAMRLGRNGYGLGFAGTF